MTGVVSEYMCVCVCVLLEMSSTPSSMNSRPRMRAGIILNHFALCPGLLVKFCLYPWREPPIPFIPKIVFFFHSKYQKQLSISEILPCSFWRFNKYKYPQVSLPLEGFLLHIILHMQWFFMGKCTNYYTRICPL